MTAPARRALVPILLGKQYQSTMDGTLALAHGYGMECHEWEPGRSLIAVVDDDESIRESLPDLLREFGFAARCFASAEEYLASDCVGETRCLILDIAMPGMSGPDLHRELKIRRQEFPVVFITAQNDEAVRQRMLEQGAAACVFKPFSDTALLAAIQSSLRLK